MQDNFINDFLSTYNKEEVKPVVEKPKETDFISAFNNPNYLKALNENRLDSTSSINDSNFNNNIVPGNNPNDVRAANQGFLSEFANSFVQTGTNLLGSGATGIIDTTAWIPNIVATLAGSEKRFGDDLANYVNKLNKDFNQEVVPVYNNNETKDVTEWFFENAPSLGTSLGLLLPVLGETALLGAAARATKGYNLYAKVLAKTAGIQEGSAAANQLLGGIEALTAGALSRHAEGMMEARDSGESAYQKAIAEGADEQTAQKVKKEAAKDTYNKNWKLLALDALQFGVAFKSFKNLSVAQNALEREALALTKPKIFGDLAFQMGTEAVEEQTQLVMSKESERDALIKNKVIADDNTRLPERLLNYAFGEYSDEFWTSSFFGALGGGVFGAVASKSENDGLKKAIIKNNQEKAVFEQKAAVILKDPQKYKDATDVTLDILGMNAIINGRAEDIENMYSAVIDTQNSNENKEEGKENIDKAQRALTRIQEYKKIYDGLASKDPISAQSIMANRSYANILDSNIANLTNETNTLIGNIATNTNLDSSFVKLLQTRAETTSLIIKKSDENVSPEVIEARLTANKELEAQLESVILENNKITKEQLDAKLQGINSGLLFSKTYDKIDSILRREQTEKDYNTLQTTEGRNLYVKDYLKSKEAFKDKKLQEITEKLNNVNTEEEINALSEEAKNIGKEKEFNLAKSKVVLNKTKTSKPIDKNNIAQTLNDRWDNNPLLKIKELKEFKQLADQSGGTIKNLPFDEEHIEKLYTTTPAFKTKIDKYISETNEPLLTNQTKDKVDVKSEKDAAQKPVEDKDEVGKFDNLWVSPINQYEYNDEIHEFTKGNDGNLIPKKSTARELINWKEVNSGSIPIGSTLHYELNFNNRSKWDNFVKENENNSNKFLVELVYYRSENERIVVGVLPSVKNIGTLEDQANLKKLREILHKELVTNSNKVGIKQSKLTTQLTQYYRGSIHNTNTQNFIKGIFDNPILGVMVKINGEVTIDTNGDTRIKNNLFQTESYNVNELGRIFHFYKHPATGKYYPVKLFTVPLSQSDLFQGVINKIQELKTAKPEIVKADLDNFLYLKNIAYTTGTYKLTLSSGEILSIPEAELTTKNEQLGKLILQIDNKRINKGDYNKQLVENNFLKTDVKPSEVFHSVNFAIKPYTENIVVEKAKVTITGNVNDSKKADIERRRQEELDKRNNSKQISELEKIKKFGNTPNEVIDNIYTNAEKEGRKYNVGKPSPGMPQQVGYTFSTEEQEAVDLVNKHFTEDEFKTNATIDDAIKFWKDDAIKKAIKLNAKYDAELAALNQSPTQQTNEVTTVKVKAKIQGVGTTKIDVIGDAKYSTADSQEFGEAFSEKEARQWFKENLPQVSVEIVDHLIEMNRKGGGKAWGVFKDKSITLYKGAPSGVEHHEAFHAVFNLFLNEYQQEQIFQELADELKIKRNTAKNGSRIFNSVDLELEEILADRFINYVQQNGNDGSLSYYVSKFFKNLWNTLTSLFTLNLPIDNLFERINTGFYKNYKIEGNNTVKYKAVGLTPFQELDALKSINYKLFETIDKYRKPGQSYIEYLKSGKNINETLTTLYGEVYNGLVDQVNDNIVKNNLSLATVLSNIADQIFILEDGKVARTGPIYEEAVRYLSNYGINIQINGSAVTIDEFDKLTPEEMADPELDIIDEDGSRNAKLFAKSIEQNPKDTIRPEVKMLLKTSKSYIYENGQFKPKANSIGLNEFADFDELVNYIHQHISSNLDNYTSEEVLSKLEELEKINPDLHDLIHGLKTNDSIRTQFFSDFSLGYFPTYLLDKVVVKQEDGESRVTWRLYNANRKGVDQLIIDEWNNNLSTVGKNKVTKEDGSIDTVAANNYYKDYLNIINSIIANKGINPELALKLSDNLNNFGISISPQVFINESKEIKFFNETITPLENLLGLLNDNKVSIKVILSSIVQGNNPYEGDTTESNAIKAVTKKVARSEKSLHQDLILNVDNKSEYAYSFPTFLHKKLGELQSKEKREAYVNNWWFSSNTFLQVLNEENNVDLLKQFRPALINGSKNEYNVGTKYFDLTPAELAQVDLNLYVNNNSNLAYYRVPLLSDSGQAVILPMKRFTKTEIIDGLYKLTLAEKQRIDKISNSEIDIKNFNKNGLQYSIVTDFNDKAELVEDEEKAKVVIENWLKNNYEESSKWYKTEGLTTDTNNLKPGMITTGVKNPISSYTSKLEEFYYNKLFANVNLMQLTSVDFSFYKKDKNTDFTYSDFIKRNGQNWKATRMLDVNASYENFKVREHYNVLYVTDEEGSAKQEFLDNVVTELKRQGYNKSEIDSILSNYSKSDSVNSTDSQTFISPNRKKEVSVGFGEWSTEKEEAFKAVMKGTNDTVPYNTLFQVEKPFYYNHHNLSDITVPTQIKNSEVMLSDQYIGESPKLKAIWKLLKSGKVDSIIFTSAIKTGEYNSVTVGELLGNTNIDDKIHKFSNKYYGRQNEIPSKHIDKEILFGSQVKVLITADIPETAKFFDGALNKKEIYDIYQQLLTKNIKDSYNQIASTFTDIKKLQKALLEQVDNLNLGQDFKDNLKINADGKFELPLYDPIFGQKFQSILTALVRNNVTKQKMNGASLVNMSDYGYSDELNIVVENGIKYYEIYLPSWTKSGFPRNSKGEVQIDKLPEELKDLFGYRIPTEHKYSMKRFRVKGFTPDFMGGVVVLPGIITKIAGEDFDKDTTYIMLPNTEAGENSNEVRKVQYDKEKLFSEIKENKDEYLNTLSKAQTDNAIQDIMKEIWSSPAMSNQIIEPSSFQTLKDLKEKINNKLGVNNSINNPIIPTKELDYFKIITNGNNLIGVAANHLTNHALAQYSSLELKTSVDFNNEKAISLNNIDTLDGNKLISKNLAEFVAAFVDNTKDPVANELNINLFTIDTLLMIVRLGHDLETAIYFINQPAIRTLTKRYFDKGATKEAERFAFKITKNNLVLKSNNTTVKGKYQFSKNELLNGIKNPTELTQEEYSQQLEILSTFETYKKQADVLSKLVRSSKSYVNGVEKTIGSTTFNKKLKQDVLDSHLLSNANTLFDVPLVKASDEYGVIKPTNELLNLYLPYSSELFENLLDKARDNKGDELSSDEINFLNRQFITFYMSGFNAFDLSESNKFINEFPLYFNNKIKSNSKYNKFKIVKYLRYVGVNKNNQVPRIELISSATISPTQKEEIKISLRGMLESKDTSIKELAENLIKYNFYTTKFNFTYSGFAQLIPNEYTQKLKDSDNNFYRDYLYKMQELSFKDATFYNDVFLKQFYTHSNTKYGNRLLKIIDDKDISNKSARYKNYIPSIAFNKIKAKELNLSQKTLYIKNNNNVYKYSGFTADGSIIYNIIENRGYESNIFEYDITDRTSSVLKINKLPEFPEELYFKADLESSNQGDLFAQLVNENNSIVKEEINVELNKVLYGWATSLGIKVEQIEDLKTRLNTDAKGIADIFNNLILISKSKADVNTLPEEIGHFAEAYLRGDVFHSRLMELIENTQTYKDVKTEYGELYNNDETKLKQEAIGKLIGQTIVKRYPEVRKSNNNIILQFLEGLWNKFVNIFKKSNENEFQSEVNTILNSIADRVLSNDISSFKKPTDIKLGETLYALANESKLNAASELLKESIDNIYKKIKIYEKVSQTASSEYLDNRQKLLNSLEEELNKKNYEKGLLDYVVNANTELQKVAERYNKIIPENLTNNLDRLEVVNTLKHARDYVDSFKEILHEIKNSGIFEGEVRQNIVIINDIIDTLEVDSLKKLRAILTPILQEFNSNSNFDVAKTLNVLDKDLNLTKTWGDAMAESRNGLLEILDIITKNSKEIWRQKLIEKSKELLAAQKEFEAANLGSTSFVAERDNNGNITGYTVREYNYFDYFKEKERFFKENPKPERSKFKTAKEFIAASKDFKNKSRKWFKENTKERTKEQRKEYIAKKKEYFNSVYGETVGKSKFRDWYKKNTAEFRITNEYGDQEIVQEDRNALTLPADKYLSEQYKDIQSNEARKKYYDKMTQTLEDLDKILPERFKLNGKLPQIRKDFYERTFQENADGKKGLKPLKQILKDSKVSIAEHFVKNENDTDFGLTNENGEAINLIPVYYTRSLEDMSNLSLDITSSVAAFAASVYDFNALNKVVNILETTKNVIANSKVLTGKKDLITKTSDLVTNLRGKEVKYKNQTKSGKDSLIYTRLNNYLEMVFYGQMKKQEFIGNVNVGKTIDTINRYTSLNSIALNIYSGISNITFGTAMVRTEAISGEFYGNEEDAKANAIYASEVGSVVSNIGQRLSDSKLQLWDEKLNVMQDYARDFKDLEANKNTLFTRMFKVSSLYFINHIGEHYMQNRTSLALAQRIKLKDKEGNIITLWDAYDKIDNKLVLKEGLTKVGYAITEFSSKDKAEKFATKKKGEVEQYKNGYIVKWTRYSDLFKKQEDGMPLEEKDVVRFINRQNFVNKRLHGIYNDIDRAAVQKYALGRIATLFRKYIKPGFNRRFELGAYSQEGEIYTEGNYTTVFRLAKEIVKDMKKLGFAAITQKNLTDQERANVYRTATEALYMISIAVLAGVATGWSDDDEDNYGKALLAYQLHRQFTEMAFYWNPQEGLKILKSPAAAVTPITNTFKLLQFWNWLDENERGKYKGYNELEEGLLKTLPLVGTKVNAFNPREQLQYFTNKH